MKREFNVVIERDSEGILIASVPSLRECHTQATSQDELFAVQETLDR
jgi:predicted RNase H-like HicB family nuclease